MSAVEREAYERQLAEKEAAAAAEVARKEAELRSVQQAAAAQVAEAETQLEELSQEVGRCWAAVKGCMTPPDARPALQGCGWPRPLDLRVPSSLSCRCSSTAT